MTECKLNQEVARGMGRNRRDTRHVWKTPDHEGATAVRTKTRKNEDWSTQEEVGKITCVKTEQRRYNLTLNHDNNDDDDTNDADEQFGSIPRNMWRSSNKSARIALNNKWNSQNYTINIFLHYYVKTDLFPTCIG